MDALGFVFATTFLATVFAVFGIIGRIVDGVVDGLRYTVAPTMIGGFSAWEERRAASTATTTPPTDPADHGDEGADGLPPDTGAPGLVVPVQPLPERGWHRFGLLMRGHVARTHQAG